MFDSRYGHERGKNREVTFFFFFLFFFFVSLFGPFSVRVLPCAFPPGTHMAFRCATIFRLKQRQNPPFFIFTSSSSIGTTALCGLWPVEQCPSIFSYLPPTLSIFSLPALEDLFLFPLSIFSRVFPFFTSLPVLV